MTLLEDEDGANRVEQILRSEEVLIPFLAALEIYYISVQERSEDEAEQRLQLLKQLPSTWLNTVEDDVLIAAGRLKARLRLSLADALIAGFASSRQAILVHKDPEFEAATDVRQERLPYKR
jgi:predicted nucleic acid-binding protein